jgi:hypothetical protein
MAAGGESQAPAPAPIPTATPTPTPTFSITLGGRTACVTPSQSCQARADGGAIDLQATSNTLSAFLTGTVAANAHLGTTGTAAETFHLVQEFEITSSDPKVTRVSLTLDSALVGYVRSRHKAGASMKLAAAMIRPANWDNSPLAVAHPMQSVNGAEASLCNQHLEPLVVPSMPVGRYVLTADFLIEAVAGGLCDGHSVADFSPSTSLPADWIRTKDPFQGVDKKNFGFAITLTVAADNPEAAKSAATRTRAPEVIKTSATISTPTPSRRAVPVDAKGFDRLIRR